MSGALRAASVAGTDEASKMQGEENDRIRRGSKSMDEVQLGGAMEQIAPGVDMGKAGGGIRRLHSNWNTFGMVNNKNLSNASTDASGAQFALDRRSSMDLDPGWLSDLRLIKSQIQARASALDVLAQRVATVVNEAGSTLMVTGDGGGGEGGGGMGGSGGAARGGDGGGGSGSGGGGGALSNSVAGGATALGSLHSTSAGRVAPPAFMRPSSAPFLSGPVASSSSSSSSSSTSASSASSSSASSSSVFKSVFKRVSSKAAREIIRNMLTIAGNLSQAKELRDFFEDVMERVCDPLLQTMGMRAYVNHVTSKQHVGGGAGVNNSGSASRGGEGQGLATTGHARQTAM